MLLNHQATLQVCGCGRTLKPQSMGLITSSDRVNWYRKSKRQNPILIHTREPGMVKHTFNPSTWEAEAGGALSLRPPWSTEQVPEQPGLHRETLPWKPKPRIKQTGTTTSRSRWHRGGVRGRSSWICLSSSIHSYVTFALFFLFLLEIYDSILQVTNFFTFY